MMNDNSHNPQFDAYHKWFGIPPEEQPPHYYALLGLTIFESDREAIRNAADQKLLYVRSFEQGEHAAVSRKLLNEVVSAKRCLLDATKKREYDRGLDKELTGMRYEEPSPQPSGSYVEIDTSLETPTDGRLDDEVADEESTVDRLIRAFSLRRPQAIILATLTILVFCSAVIFFITRLGPGITFEPIDHQVITAGRSVEIPLQLRDAESLAGTPEFTLDAESAELGVSIDANTGRLQWTPSRDQVGNTYSVTVFASADGLRGSTAFSAEVQERKTKGITADRIVLWNQHNIIHRNRGTRSVDVELRLDDEVVFVERNVVVPWSPTKALSKSLTLPSSLEFDKLRVDFKSWHKKGAGLGEIEVWKGEKNLARGRMVKASGFIDVNCVPSFVNDGLIHFEKHQKYAGGFWLLPNYSPGWIEMDFSIEPTREPLGVLAEELVIWNTHDRKYQTSGMTKCNIALKLGNVIVWQKKDLKLNWRRRGKSPTIIALPKRRFDRVRIDVLKEELRFGGLSEIEVVSKGINLARGRPVDASDFHGLDYNPRTVTDGVNHSFALGGYWVLPEKQTGWIEVDLAGPRTATPAAVVADRIVVWNQHHHEENDRGTLEFNLQLLRSGNPIWEKKEIAIPWEPFEDFANATIKLPHAAEFDTVRVEVTRWQGKGGGLAEIEVWQGEKNLALGRPAMASAFWPRSHYLPTTVTDGITGSGRWGGYWLLPDKSPGWIEVAITDAAVLRHPIPSETGSFERAKFKVVDTPVTWRQAVRRCKEMGGRLVRIDSQKKQDFVESLLADHSLEFYWIDGEDDLFANDWRFSNGQPMHYTNWDKIEPDNRMRDEKLVIQRKTGLWNDSHSGFREAGFICELEPDPVAPRRRKNPGISGTSRFQGHRYLLVETAVTWNVAKKRCEEMGGHLLRIESKAEQQFTETLLRSGSSYSYWLDGSDDEKENSWVFTDNRPLPFFNWYKNRPNNTNKGQHCLRIYRERGTWEDAEAGWYCGFICEWDD